MNNQRYLYVHSVQIATLQVTPQITKNVDDIRVRVLKSETGLLEPVVLTVGYNGFITTPHVQWSYAGKPVDRGVWQLRTDLNESSIFSNILHLCDQGVYECQIVDSQTGFEMKSVGKYAASILEESENTLIIVVYCGMYNKFTGNYLRRWTVVWMAVHCQ